MEIIPVAIRTLTKTKKNKAEMGDCPRSAATVRTKGDSGFEQPAMSNVRLNCVAESQQTILMIEDDLLLSDIFSRKFTAEHFTMLYAPTGEKGLELLQTRKPDVILLDLTLPGLSGFDVLKKINEDPTTMNIPVIILSNLSEAADIQKGRELGAVNYLAKVPLSLEEIVNAVRNACPAKT